MPDIVRVITAAADRGEDWAVIIITRAIVAMVELRRSLGDSLLDHA